MGRRIDLNNYLQDGKTRTNAGNSKHGKIDKTGRCYHATQQTWCKEPVFNRDIGEVQASLWPDEMVEEAEKGNIHLL